jgi:hypothetical protein
MHKKKNPSNGILTEHIHVDLSGILSPKKKNKNKMSFNHFPHVWKWLRQVQTSVARIYQKFWIWTKIVPKYACNHIWNLVFFKYSSFYIFGIKCSCNYWCSCISGRELLVPVCTFGQSWMDSSRYEYAYLAHNRWIPMYNWLGF